MAKFPDGTVVQLTDGRIGRMSKGRLVDLRHPLEGERVTGTDSQGREFTGVVRMGRVVPEHGLTFLGQVLPHSTLGGKPAPLDFFEALAKRKETK